MKIIVLLLSLLAFRANADVITILMSEDAYQGDAIAQVTIDNVVVATPTVTSQHGKGSQRFDYTVASFAAGAHTIKVTFTNDLYGGTAATDRNLYIDQVFANGVSLSTTSTELYSAGDSMSYGFSYLGNVVNIPYMIGYTASDSTAAADIAGVNAWLGRPIDISAMTVTMSGWWYGGIPKSYAVDVSFPMLSISGWDSVGATDMGKAASGAYDQFYTQMAKTLAAAGNQMIVRIGWEMNGNWYPWSINNGANNTAANYIATFQRIVKILRSNVPNVKIEFNTAWEYQPYTYPNGSSAGAPTDYWPGAAYVDYVSMDVYEANNGNFANQKSTGAYNLDWLVKFATQNNVKIGMPEWGASGGDVSYINSMIAWENCLGSQFAYSVYSSWSPADQFLIAGQNSAEQAAFIAAYKNTVWSGSGFGK